MRLKRAYRICVAAPPGYAHYRCLWEVALVLKYSFESLGLECDLTLNEMAIDRMNILLGYHQLAGISPPSGFQYIIYQLEQLSEREGFYSDRARQVLANGCEVWDYAEENIAFLARRGIRARYLPIGYHEKLDVIPRGGKKDVDILFVGSVSERREKFFRRIQETTALRLKILFGVYGQERDAWLGRARVILNVHQFSGMQILESPRVAYLLNNGCFFLCENASNNPYAAIELKFGDLEEIESMCDYYLASPQQAESLADQWYRQFRRDYRMVKLLSAVL